MWLKGKGDDFYRSGDYSGAANAYTAAIDIDGTATACISNRAACLLHLGKLEECVRDCSTALQLTNDAATVEALASPAAKKVITHSLFASVAAACAPFTRTRVPYGIRLLAEWSEETAL